MNIWTLLLSGLLWLINALVMPLFGTGADQSSAVNLASVIGQNGLIILQMYFVAFGTFNLTFVFIYFGLFILVKGIQIVVSIWLFIKSLIPKIN